MHYRACPDRLASKTAVGTGAAPRRDGPGDERIHAHAGFAPRPLGLSTFASIGGYLGASTAFTGHLTTWFGRPLANRQ